ncbi:hypothetical protein VCHA53O466_50050 [Vibrio chagasii]|nr:hypothetical protein VCHA53O466_50050 [Vibrio chagasii]
MSTPTLYTVDELFSGDNWDGLHDTILEIYDVCPTREQAIVFFYSLPDHIKSDALEWGLNDTEFANGTIDYLESNPTELIKPDAAKREAFLLMINNSLGERVASMHSRLWDKYGEPMCGNSRAVYLSKHYVFKLPINIEGGQHNLNEVHSNSCNLLKLAKTKMVNADLGLTVMERVSPATTTEIKSKLGVIPEFVWSIDCAQVGFTRKGKLVAYDFG